MGGTIMRAMTNEVYYDRLGRAQARGRRQVIGWLAFGIVVCAMLAGGLGTVASRGDAGGGRVQPQTVPARAVFKQVLWRKMGHYTPGLMQNCMGSKCAVFTRDLGTSATFVRVGGAWHLRTLLVPAYTATK